MGSSNTQTNTHIHTHPTAVSIIETMDFLCHFLAKEFPAVALQAHHDAFFHPSTIVSRLGLSPLSVSPQGMNASSARHSRQKNKQTQRPRHGGQFYFLCTRVCTDTIVPTVSFASRCAVSRLRNGDREPQQGTSLLRPRSIVPATIRDVRWDGAERRAGNKYATGHGCGANQGVNG